MRERLEIASDSVHLVVIMNKEQLKAAVKRVMMSVEDSHN